MRNDKIEVLTVYVHTNTERALQEVIEDLAAVGVLASGTDLSHDLLLDLDGRALTVDIKRASVVSPAHVHSLPEYVASASTAIQMLVADRISEARLFESVKLRLRLLETRTFRSGANLLRYAAAE